MSSSNGNGNGNGNGPSTWYMRILDRYGFATLFAVVVLYFGAPLIRDYFTASQAQMKSQAESLSRIAENDSARIRQNDQQTQILSKLSDGQADIKNAVNDVGRDVKDVKSKVVK